MLSILLSVVFGLAIGYFATQNTAPVTIQFGDLVLDNVPLYMITVGSLILGLLIAWIFYIARTVSTSLTIAGKNHEIKRSSRTLGELEQKIHELEAENSGLRTEIAAASRLSVPATEAHRESIHLNEQTRRSRMGDIPPL